MVVDWKIHANGSISDLAVSKHGTNAADERSALDAVRASTPFERLPDGVGTLSINFDFHRGERSAPLGMSVAQAIKKFGPAARVKIARIFAGARMSYPPKHVDLVCFKDQGVLVAFARGVDGKTKRLKSYDIVSSSGEAGPKLHEGDLQVPEGFYKIDGMNAMTHMALSVDYPNAADRAHAISDHRANLGGYIQVHGGVYSTGCVVLSNEDMAELFVIANDIGCSNVSLLIAPCNLLETKPEIDFSKQPKWLPKLYGELKQALAKLPAE